VPLEEESKRLRNELDANQKKIVAHMERAHDGPQSSAGQPSEQVHLTSVITRSSAVAEGPRDVRVI